MTFSPPVFAALLMLLSAISHAVIGAIMKQRDDKLVFRGLIGLTCASLALPLTLFVNIPSAQAWVWLGIGAGLHFIYQLSQVAAFNRGDMGLVYPVMRGVAPAGVGLFAFLILGEALSPLTMTGLAIVVLSLIGFAWPERSAPKGWKAALAFAGFCCSQI